MTGHYCYWIIRGRLLFYCHLLLFVPCSVWCSYCCQWCWWSCSMCQLAACQGVTSCLPLSLSSDPAQITEHKLWDGEGHSIYNDKKQPAVNILSNLQLTQRKPNDKIDISLTSVHYVWSWSWRQYVVIAWLSIEPGGRRKQLAWLYHTNWSITPFSTKGYACFLTQGNLIK